MEWDDLKYVLATVRSGSFLGAANMLRVTHTTVGRRISALEKELGQDLFKRTREGCLPTELCQSILPAAAVMEEQIRRIAVTSEQFVSEPSGLVRIHTAGWIIETALAPRVPELVRAYPSIRVSLVADVVEAFNDPSVPTMHLRFDVMSKRSETDQEIGRIPFSLYLPEGRAAESLGWVSNHGGNIALKTLEWLGTKSVSEDDILATASDAAGVCAMIRAGVGKGLIPDCIGQRESGVRRAHDGPADVVRHLRMIHDRRLSDVPELQAVKSWVTKALNDSGVFLDEAHPV